MVPAAMKLVRSCGIRGVRASRRIELMPYAATSSRITGDGDIGNPFDDGSNISSGSQSSGTFSRTFTAAGTYKYHCTIHGSAMSGQVVVQ